MWLEISVSDGSSSVYPYGPTPTDGIYVLKESQTYELSIDFASARTLFLDSIGMEYDDTIFEIVCLTTPESPEYEETVYYNLTCLKTCESTSFVAYTIGSRDSYMYSQQLLFKVE